MLGGGGVDGAIHQAAGGNKLYEACKAVSEVRPGVRCPTGEARITPGFDLPAKFVIHTVGPVWQGGSSDEDQLLANCYRNSLNLAVENRISSIAFPAISTGVYGFPLERGAFIAVREVRKLSAENESIQRVIFACFGDQAMEVYQAALLNDRQAALP